ncbi:MAG TPA: VOC family protein [Actinophytocola sp.]|jgi:predicted enzyme related to lactoylglutathione lyase|nr:VOC family protein [Actinophytocola sp.]
MTGELAHFAINADDIDATKAFYETVFGWSFEPWGPPDFFQIDTGAGAAPLRGALQRRRELVPGEKTIGFECTVAVSDVDAVTRAAVAAGGRVVMRKSTITGVGDLVFVADPSGNVVGAMRFDESAG